MEASLLQIDCQMIICNDSLTKILPYGLLWTKSDLKTADGVSNDAFSLVTPLCNVSIWHQRQHCCQSPHEQEGEEKSVEGLEARDQFYSCKFCPHHLTSLKTT